MVVMSSELKSSAFRCCRRSNPSEIVRPAAFLMFSEFSGINSVAGLRWWGQSLSARDKLVSPGTRVL